MRRMGQRSLRPVCVRPTSEELADQPIRRTVPMAQSVGDISYSDIGVRLDLWPIALAGRCAILPEPDFPAARTKGQGVVESTRRTILSVDDEQSILDLIRIEFEDDFDVVTARSGEEALDLLTHQPVDVVLLDLRMPQMGGEEFLRRLKTPPGRPPGGGVGVVREAGALVRG